MIDSLVVHNLNFATLAMGLTLLAISSWRLRTTAVGRSYLAFLLVSDGWAIARLPVSQMGVGEEVSAFAGVFCALLVAATVLRLATQVAQDGGALSLWTEATIWIPPAIVLVLGNHVLVPLWMAVTFAVAGIRFTQVPLRSWEGFVQARFVTTVATILPGASPILWLAGASPLVMSIVAPTLILSLSIVFYYALPRLGVLASDRVQHGTVIEAMDDGVLVVDMSGRLVEFNQAASDILKLGEEMRHLPQLTVALAHHPDLVELFSGAIEGRSVYVPEASAESDSGSDDEDVQDKRTYDLQLSPLWDSTGAIRSRVLVLRDISDRMAIEEDSRRQASYVRLVHQVSATVHEADTIEHGLEAALELIGNMMGFGLGHFLKATDSEDGGQLIASGVIYCGIELDRSGGSIVFPSVVRLETEASSLDASFPADSPYAELGNGSRLVGSAGAADPKGLSWWKDLGFKLVLTVPILIGPRLYGIFEFFSADNIEVDAASVEILEHVGELVGRAVERKLADEKIRRLAYRDDLTGLPNRQRFNQLLQGAVSLAARSNRRMALLFMDLDGFKKVNDTLGHDVGDKLLAEVAHRFSTVVRASDHLGRVACGEPAPAVSRLGGDEFTVLLTEINNPTDASLVAGRLLATLETPIVLDGQELFMSTSIGIAVYPEDGNDTESLLRNSDAAMYFAKGRGRNCYSFYNEEMNRSRSERLEVESRLRGALERDDFEVHYQPILDAQTGRVVAAEALVRWVDDELGFVPPDRFISVAEETGLIVSLGAWVFRTACEQARRWREELGASIRIGVNVSGHQIREPGLIQMVRDALDETGVAPEQVELEITESTIMQDDALTIQTLGDLKSMGVRIALDDFGTGYSSLSYLRRFTIDHVKIDRSFVNELPENVGDAALTSAIIAMAHGLNLDVVAEGVETPRQALFLKQRGCDELQGYLFGRPCRASEFVDLLRAKPRTIEERKDDEDESDEPSDEGTPI